MTADLQRQFDTATAYFLAAERCVPTVRFGRYGFHSVSAPTIANYAFSVEIALKLLHLILRGVGTRGHDLHELYQALPDEARSKLPHLEEYALEIARQFEDWRYPYEKDFLVADTEDARRAFIECYQEIRRIRPGLVSVYEGLWGSFNPGWMGAEVTSIEVQRPRD